MSSNDDKLKPIRSRAEKDLFFTDPSYEMSGTSAGGRTNAKRVFRKKPWFSQKMNQTGRFYQFMVGFVISLVAFAVGLNVLSIPMNPSSIKLLLKYGYRGPYKGLQVVDMKLSPAHTPENNVVSAQILLYNFEDTVTMGKPIQVTLRQKEHPTQSHHIVECCRGPIVPNGYQSVSALIKNKNFGVETVEAKTIKDGSVAP